MELPIAAYLPQISAAVERSKITIIRAPPGSGKSTLIPQYLLTDYKSIVLTTPRRSAAFALHKFMRGCGVRAGLLMRGVREIGAENQLIIATEGSALLCQLQADLFIFDEAHELTDELQLLLAGLKTRLLRNPQNGGLRAVLMSATLDCGCFLRYFGADQCEIINVAVQQLFSVEIKLNKATFSSYQTQFMSEMKRLIASALPLGPVLAFLPGKREIDVLKEQFDYVQPQVFHSRSSNLAALISRQHALILATDAAETSLTLKNLAAVVDSGLRKRPEFVNNGRCLRLDLISADARAQRIGRLGRVCAGCYFAAYNKAIWSQISDIKHEPSPDPFKFCVFLAQRHSEGREPHKANYLCQIGEYNSSGDSGEVLTEFVHPCAVALLCQQINKMEAFHYFAPPPERGVLNAQSARLLRLSFLGSFERIALAAICATARAGTALAGAALAAALGVLEEIDFRAICWEFRRQQSGAREENKDLQASVKINERAKDFSQGRLKMRSQSESLLQEPVQRLSGALHCEPLNQSQQCGQSTELIIDLQQQDELAGNDFLALLRHAIQVLAASKSAELQQAFSDICKVLEIGPALRQRCTKKSKDFYALVLDQTIINNVMKAVQQTYSQQTAQFALSWSVAGRAAFISNKSTFQPAKSSAREVVYESLFSAGGKLEMVCVAARAAGNTKNVESGE